MSQSNSVSVFSGFISAYGSLISINEGNGVVFESIPLYLLKHVTANEQPYLLPSKIT